MIYLDFNATTPLLPEALAAMEEVVRAPGNPSSLHAAGQAARRRLDSALGEVAALVDAEGRRVLLTGSGSEANALAVRGLASRAAAGGRRRVLVSAVEHPCVRAAAAALERDGMVVDVVPVLASGVLDVAALESRLADDVSLVAVMLANNETGVVQPLERVVELCAPRGILVHTDAVQAVGKIPVSFARLGVSSLALAGHKLGGPKGVGALVLADGLDPEPLWEGGGQQGGLRPGTLPVPLAAALGVAAAAAGRRLATGEHALHRDRLERELAALPGAFVIGAGVRRLPNTSALGFEGVPAAALVERLSARGIMIGAGSACHSGEARPSSVLLAMGVAPERALEVARFSAGWSTTEADVDATVAAVAAELHGLRAAA